MLGGSATVGAVKNLAENPRKEWKHVVAFLPSRPAKIASAGLFPRSWVARPFYSSDTDDSACVVGCLSDFDRGVLFLIPLVDSIGRVVV